MQNVYCIILYNFARLFSSEKHYETHYKKYMYSNCDLTNHNTTDTTSFHCFVVNDSDRYVMIYFICLDSHYF